MEDPWRSEVSGFDWMLSVMMMRAGLSAVFLSAVFHQRETVGLSAASLNTRFLKFSVTHVGCLECPLEFSIKLCEFERGLAAQRGFVTAQPPAALCSFKRSVFG